jgi:hypothetical protein
MFRSDPWPTSACSMAGVLAQQSGKRQASQVATGSRRRLSPWCTQQVVSRNGYAACVLASADRCCPSSGSGAGAHGSQPQLSSRRGPSGPSNAASYKRRSGPGAGSNSGRAKRTSRWTATAKGVSRPTAKASGSRSRAASASSTSEKIIHASLIVCGRSASSHLPASSARLAASNESRACDLARLRSRPGTRGAA